MVPDGVAAQPVLFCVHASVILRWSSCWRHCTPAGPVHPVSAILSGFRTGRRCRCGGHRRHLRGAPSAGRVAGCLRVAKLSGESLVGLVDDHTGCGELLVAFQGQSEEVPAAVVGVARG